MIKQPRNVVLWDLDDTLFWTSEAYSLAFIDFYHFVARKARMRMIEIRTLGTISEEIDHKLIEEINPDTGRPYGYSKQRFPESLVRTYRFLVERKFLAADQLTEDNIRAIGYSAFNALVYQEQGLVKGARDTLNFFRDRGDLQVLITKGDRDVQESKILGLELGTWFAQEYRHIVDGKSAEMYAAYVAKYSRSVVWSIGNSYTSDILPALEAGCRGIFIPYYTWRGEPEVTDIDPKVFKRYSISEVPKLFTP